jgi:hypothetical protein
MEINCFLLRELQRTRAEWLCRQFFSQGKKSRDEWHIADRSGAPGSSLAIQLSGAKAGLWLDRATGDKGDFVKLLCINRGINFPAAVELIERAVGISLHRDQQQKPKSLRLDGLKPCAEADLQRISNLRGIPIEGLRLASERKTLFRRGDEFVVTDEARRNAIRRRLDGKPFVDTDPKTGELSEKKSKCAFGAKANWPIGIAQSTGFPAIALCEGAPDFLAAFYLAYAGAVEQLVAPVCMTGASCSIHPEALIMLRGKRVRIFGHADQPGQAAMRKWAAQLRSVTLEVDGFYFEGLVKADGSQVNDLNDFIGADHRRSGCPIEVVTGAFNFTLKGCKSL